MADIFNEIDEELRGDQMRRLWRNYSGVVVAVALLIVVGVAGWRGWEYWAEQTARSDGDKYLAALQLSAKGDAQGAEAALKGLSTGASAGYRTLARLGSAEQLVGASDQSGALAAFDAIANDRSTPAPFKGFAEIRAAYLALDLEDPTKLIARVKPLSAAGNPWRFAAREILAVSAWKSGDIATAKSLVEQLQSDAETPSDLGHRIELLASVIAADKKPDLAPAAASAPTAPQAVTPPAPQPEGQSAPATPAPAAKVE